MLLAGDAEEEPPGSLMECWFGEPRGIVGAAAVDVAEAAAVKVDVAVDMEAGAVGAAVAVAANKDWICSSAERGGVDGVTEARAER